MISLLKSIVDYYFGSHKYSNLPERAVPAPVPVHGALCEINTTLRESDDRDQMEKKDSGIMDIQTENITSENTSVAELKCNNLAGETTQLALTRLSERMVVGVEEKDDRFNNNKNDSSSGDSKRDGFSSDNEARKDVYRADFIIKRLRESPPFFFDDKVTTQHESKTVKSQHVHIKTEVATQNENSKTKVTAQLTSEVNTQNENSKRAESESDDANIKNAKVAESQNENTKTREITTKDDGFPNINQNQIDNNDPQIEPETMNISDRLKWLLYQCIVFNIKSSLFILFQFISCLSFFILGSLCMSSFVGKTLYSVARRASLVFSAAWTRIF
jgi:hypothetical protein